MEAAEAHPRSAAQAERVIDQEWDDRRNAGAQSTSVRRSSLSERGRRADIVKRLARRRRMRGRMLVRGAH
jgi:hypothetical protein